MQALREERKGLRHHLQEKLGVDGETLDKIAPAFDSPYANPNAEYENDPTTTNLYVCNIPKDVISISLIFTFIVAIAYITSIVFRQKLKICMKLLAPLVRWQALKSYIQDQKRSDLGISYVDLWLI